MYTGNTVGALTPLASASGFAQLNVPVVAGTSYRIAVDGPQDIPTGEAARAGFQLQVWMDVPPPLPVQPQGRLGVPLLPADVVAPNTAIGKRKLGRHSAKLWFSADEAGVGFRCRLDGRTVTACGLTQGLPRSCAGSSRLQGLCGRCRRQRRPQPRDGALLDCPAQGEERGRSSG